jgi:hypothetical protein
MEMKSDLSHLNKQSLFYCYSFTPRQKGIFLGSANDKESVYSCSFNPSCE